jgi:hypothetical protein
MKIDKLVMATLGVLLFLGVSARGQTGWEVVKTGTFRILVVVQR